MALQQTKITVTDTASLIIANTGKIAKMRVYLVNTGGSHDVFIGNSSVTSSNGYILGKFQSTGINNRFQIDLFSGDELYGICSSGNSTTITFLVAGTY
jgi:hypothetical protein